MCVTERPVAQPVGGQRRHVEPEHDEDAAVATLPELVGEAREPREGLVSERMRMPGWSAKVHGC